MTSSLSSAFQPYFTDIVNVHASISMTISGCVLLVYDWLLTLDQEVEFLRYNRKRAFKVAYIINRYTLPFVLVITLYDKNGHSKLTHLLYVLSDDMSLLLTIPSSCKISLMTDSWFTLLSYAFIHGIIAMRTWALYGRQHWLLLLLIAGFVAYFVATATLLGFAAEHMLPRLTINTLMFDSCITELPSWMWAIWLPGFMYETLLFGLLVDRARRDFQRRSNLVLLHAPPLLICLYRDGLVYYVVITCTSFFTMMVWAFAPHSLIFLSKYFSLCAVNAAASRLVLQLNSQSRTARPTEPSTTLTHVGQHFLSVERYHAQMSEHASVYRTYTYDYDQDYDYDYERSELSLSKQSEHELAMDTLRSMGPFEAQ